VTNTALLITAKNPISPIEIIGKMPLISHSITKLPQVSRLIILTDENKNYLLDYVNCAHPDKKITIHSISQDPREDIVLDQELVKIENEFKVPFFIINSSQFPIDDLFGGNENWCSESVQHVYDFNNFWREIKEGNSVNRIVEKYKKRKVAYFDISTNEKLVRAKEIYKKNDEEYDFSKPDEAIYFIKDRVVKFFSNEKIIQSRAKRAKLLNGAVPNLDFVGRQFYSYKLVPGKTMYNSLEPKLPTKFFNWCTKHLWNSQELHLNPSQQSEFFEACIKFYKEKTLERINLYWENSGQEDSISTVNQIETPKLSELISKINWDYVAHGEASRFHGDLQFDNVIYSPNYKNNFVLLDWRQDFAGLIEYGDVYYDLAKIYGGLIIPYNSIKNNNFTFMQDGTSVKIKIDPVNYLDEARKEFRSFINENNYDRQKIQLITGIIFINMSPLHTKPFNHLLHHLGKLILTNVIYA